MREPASVGPEDVTFPTAPNGDAKRVRTRVFRTGERGNAVATHMGIGDVIQVEPGNMTGPTVQGVEELIARDPNAHWDTAAQRVVSQFHPSPRIIVIPVFDPYVYEQGMERGRQDLNVKVANFVAFFLEGVNADRSVMGRMVPMTGLVRGTAPAASYLRAIRLVE